VLPVDAYVTRLEDLEGHDGGVHPVPQLVGEEPEPVAAARRLTIERGPIPRVPVLGDGASDGVVETAVQRAEVLRSDGRVGFHRQFGDGLTDITVVVHDLRQREALPKKGFPVPDAARADLRGRDHAQAQRVRQLAQEHRHPVIDFRGGGRWRRPRRHLLPAPPDDFVPIDRDELMEHG
jgi:hypothetical protein